MNSRSSSCRGLMCNNHPGVSSNAKQLPQTPGSAVLRDFEFVKRQFAPVSRALPLSLLLLLLLLLALLLLLWDQITGTCHMANDNEHAHPSAQATAATTTSVGLVLKLPSSSFACNTPSRGGNLISPQTHRPLRTHAGVAAAPPARRRRACVSYGCAALRAGS